MIQPRFGLAAMETQFGRDLGKFLKIPKLDKIAPNAINFKYFDPGLVRHP